MAREPTYPEDASVGDAAASSSHESAGGDPNAPKGEPNRAKHLMTGAAIGIGSAALVAALLYANRSRKGDNKGDKTSPNQASEPRND